MRFTTICLVLIMIAATDSVIASDQSVPDGTIYGHVYDAQTKQPVSGAFVYCQEAKCKPIATDSNGYYAIDNCFSPSSTYVIQCTKNGYSTAKNTAQTDSSGKAKVDFNLGNAPNPPPNPTPTKSWNKTFGGPANDHGQSVQQTADGGYIVGGNTVYTAKGTNFVIGSAIQLIKTDNIGNKQWDMTINGSFLTGLGSVQQTSDNEYIIAGSLASNAENEDVWLIKIDSQGNKIWDKTYGKFGYEVANSVQQTNDGGYIIYGDKMSNNGDRNDLWLIKTDSLGNKLWDRTFAGASSGSHSVQQTSDGGYILIGLKKAITPGYSYAWLIKTNSKGNMQWDKTFEEYEWWSSYVEQTSDNGYIIAGQTSTDVADVGFDIKLIKTDSLGKKQWDKTFGGADMFAFPEVQQTSDGGFAIASYTSSFDIWLIKTDSNGDMQWDRTFGESKDKIGFPPSIQQTSDGGYIIVGTTSSYGAGGQDIWLIKTDSEGN